MKKLERAFLWLSRTLAFLLCGASLCWSNESFQLLEPNWADIPSRNGTCRLLASFTADKPQTDYSPVLIRNAVPLVPDLFGDVQTFSFALGASRGRVTVSQTLKFDSVNENLSRAKLKGLEQLRLRDMTLMEFYSRVTGSWDTLYFAKEFYLFSGRLPKWFQQGKFHQLRPLSCLRDASCPGCDRIQGRGPTITSAKFQVTVKGSVQALRYDTNPSILLVTKGEALVQLVSPKDIAGLKPYEREHPLYRRSSLAFEDVAKKLDYIEVIVRPGDAIILDAFTAHQIHSINDSIFFTHSIRK